MVNVQNRIVGELTELIGDDLRAIATYDRSDQDMLYLRDDLTDVYTLEEIMNALDQVEIEGIGYSHFTRLFKTGEMECTTYRFEKAMMYHFPVGSFDGLFVTVDRNGDHENESIIDSCLQAISQES